MKYPKLKRDWVGLQVRTTVPLKSGYMEFPEGTILTVIENYGGLRLKGPKCPHCGVSIFISGVPERDVVILDPQPEGEKL